MERENVVYIIKYFNDIDKNMKFNSGIIKGYEDSYYSPTVTPSYTGGIHGKGGISTPVETMVLSVPEEIEEHIKEIKGENLRFCEEKAEFLKELNNLEYLRKMVIHYFYLKGYSWVKISLKLNYSQSHCRYLRDKALEDFGAVLDGNEILLKILNRKIR